MQLQINQLQEKVKHLEKEQEGLSERNEILKDMLEIRNKRLLEFKTQENNDLQIELPILNNDMQQFKRVVLRLNQPFQSSIFQSSFTQEDFRNFTIEEMVNFHHGFVSVISSHLSSLQKNNFLGHQILRDTMIEMAQFVLRVAITNPRTIRKWGMYHPLAPNPNPVSWSKIVLQLGLSEKQMTKIVQIRSLLLEELQDGAKRLKQLRANLENCESSWQCETVAAQQYLQRYEVFEGLVKFVRQIEMVNMKFSYSVRRKVLTGVQTAKFIVAAYPQGPDFIALSHCVNQLLQQKKDFAKQNICDSTYVDNGDCEQMFAQEVRQINGMLGIK
eukprot:TRINITY_DN3869_c0_g1_i8.p1 TRINITY_DN3869_c0_g1~~TRINITY_DN3869_c0_g1_i8.p1  ORF type:complete len:330 (-),score=37.76 TRINITY_DN3869_c0_g1_i8:170-1159(-)